LQKRESIKIAKKPISRPVISRKVQRRKTFAKIPDFQGKPTESPSVAQASLAVRAAGTLPADYVGFRTLPGLPPASPTYIPQTGGFEIT